MKHHAPPPPPVPRDPSSLIAVALGGGLGATLRYEIGLTWGSTGAGFPWGTLAINLIGSFLIGFVMTVLLSRAHPHRLIRPFVCIGILGGFTTFSAFSLEMIRLVQLGQILTAVLYLVVSVSAGIGAVLLGIRLAPKPIPTSEAVV